MKTTKLSKLLALLASVLVIGLADSAFAKDKGDRDRPRGPEEVFEAMDADGNGSITAKELGGSRRYKDAPKGAVAKIFKEKDLNGDGGISQHEFEKTFGANDGDGGKVRKGKGPGKGGKGKGGNSGGGKGGKGKG